MQDKINRDENEPRVIHPVSHRKVEKQIMHPLNKPSDELNTQSQIDDNTHNVILLEN